MATKKTETRIRKTQPARKAPGTALAALLAVKEIADTDGLGDNPATSERAYRLVCQAIADATGKPCGGLLGEFQPASAGKAPGTRVASAPVLEQIAREHLDIPDLETRNSDALDFFEVAVWGVRSALEAAYRAGKASR